MVEPIIGRSVTLSSLEQSIVALVGKTRAENNFRAGTADYIGLSLERRIANDMEAFGAELAAAHVINVYPDLTSDNRSSGTGTDFGDLHLQSGESIDVKWNPTEYGDLLIPLRKTHARHVDYYLVVGGRLPSYIIHGFMPHSLAVVPERINYHLPDPAYHIRKHELREVDFWFQFFKNKNIGSSAQQTLSAGGL